MDRKNLEGLTILYAEDSEPIAENTMLTLNLLNTKIIYAKDGQEGVDKFKENADNIDIILTDISMPIKDGLEMVEEIKEINFDIPIIITTAHQEINYLKKAIELKVTSFILKPLKIQDIVSSIIAAMEPVNLKKELIQKNEELLKLNNSLEEKIKERTKELEILASTDALTGVNNRRNFFIEANKKYDEAQENLYAVMIDIDNFKRINDTYGHSVGDEILIMIARTIHNNLEDADVFGRLGGEEFAIIYESNNENHIEKLEEIRKLVENQKHDKINVTISLGQAKKASDEKNIDTLLSRADRALYEAKGTGRNKLIFRDL